MKDPIEERLQDLERLVLKQAERIDALEDALAFMRHAARRGLQAKAEETPGTEAA